MQPPTDNLYKFIAIFGLVVGAFSVYVPLLRYVEFNRLSQKTSALYRPMVQHLIAIDDMAAAELECAIFQRAADKQKTPKPDRCINVDELKAKGGAARAELERLKTQVAPMEVERDSQWQEYVLFLYVGILGLVVGIAMCLGGFWLWYTRLQCYLDASVKLDAAKPKAHRVRVSRSRRGALYLPTDRS